MQNVLSEIGGDNVNSIDDTDQSQRAALLLETVYYEIISQRTWADDKQLLALSPSGDSAKPNYLKLPDNIQQLEWVRYNCTRVGETRDFWETITYQEPYDFLNRANSADSTQANITSVEDWSGTSILVRNDLNPTKWTSFDDTYLVFDSYNSATDSTLQSSKSQVYARLEPTISLVDDFVVDLPTEAFSMLISIVKNRAYLALKDTFNALVDREETRQRNRMSRKSWQAAGGVKYHNFGRHCTSGRTLSAERTFKDGKY